MLSRLMENCACKSTIAAIAGFGLGVLFGLFTSSVDPQATMAVGANPAKIVCFIDFTTHFLSSRFFS